MKEYTVKDLMKKWGISRQGVMQRIKRDRLQVVKRKVVVEQTQEIDIIILED